VPVMLDEIARDWPDATSMAEAPERATFWRVALPPSVAELTEMLAFVFDV
jgi:hypothetical protein